MSYDPAQNMNSNLLSKDTSLQIKWLLAISATGRACMHPNESSH